MHLVDHIFMFILFVVHPIHGAYAYRKVVQAIAAGAPSDRVKLYRETFAHEWIAFAVVAVAWYLLGRPAAALGFVASSGMQVGAGLGALALFSIYLLYLWQAARQFDDDQRRKETEAFGTLVHFMPQNRRDYHYFVGVSVTAGIVEEFLYRGFAFWYLGQFLPLWAVVLVSSIGFGLAHSYQGASGVVRVTLIGLAFGVFYALTGSIWLAMLAHAVLDILQGAYILEVLGPKRQYPHPTAPAGRQ